MATLPKSSAEILAAAKKAPRKKIQGRQLKTDVAFNSQLSTFPSHAEPTTTGPESLAFHWSGKAMVHSIGNTRFDNSVTPQALEAALEIKARQSDSNVEGMEGLFDDEPDLCTLVFTSSIISSFQYI